MCLHRRREPRWLQLCCRLSSVRFYSASRDENLLPASENDRPVVRLTCPPSGCYSYMKMLEGGDSITMAFARGLRLDTLSRCCFRDICGQHL